MKILNLVLTHHWYDQTASGSKRIEYRAMTKSDGSPSKWHKQIWAKRDEITHVRFSRGYTATTQTFEVKQIDIGECPIDGWYGIYFRIHFCSE